MTNSCKTVSQWVRESGGQGVSERVCSVRKRDADEHECREMKTVKRNEKNKQINIICENKIENGYTSEARRKVTKNTSANSGWTAEPMKIN